MGYVMKLFSFLILSALYISNLALAQEQNVGPILSSEVFFSRCEALLKAEEFENNPNQFTDAEKIDFISDATFCNSYLAGVFEGARYIYSLENPSKLLFCPTDQNLTEFIQRAIPARKLVPNLTREGRMASQDIIELLSKSFWVCPEE